MFLFVPTGSCFLFVTNLFLFLMNRRCIVHASQVKTKYFVLQGATIVDQIVSITPVQNYVAKREMQVNLLRSSAISFQVL
jgi:hypothetical protein